SDVVAEVLAPGRLDAAEDAHGRGRVSSGWVKGLRLALLPGAALIALSPGAAQAAYAPKLAVTLDPATYKANPALTSVVTQASGETASKTVQVQFPRGFGPALMGVMLSA